MTMMTSGATPCLSCGSKGGYAHPGCHKPDRLRGLCNKCYGRAFQRGITHHYPACGAVPIDVHQHPDWQPAPWGRVPFAAAPEVLPARWLGLPPHDTKAPAYLNQAAHARIIEAETFAAIWLARHTKAVKAA